MTPAPIELRSALDLGFDSLAEAFNASFEGYVVPLRLDSVALEARSRAECWDLGVSLVARRGAELAGVLFVARRGTRARVAAMGVVGSGRRTGVGRAMMERCLADSAARGDSRLILEVIESNQPAVALYEAMGLVRDRLLVGFEHPGQLATEHPTDLAEIDLADLAALAHAGQDPDLPWQIDAATAGNLTRPWRAFRHGPAAALILATPDRVTLRALVVPPPVRRRGHASALVTRLHDTFPGRTWAVPAIVPEGLADGFMTHHGYTRTPIAQWEMSCDPSAATTALAAQPALSE